MTWLNPLLLFAANATMSDADALVSGEHVLFFR
jgi:hypothetical protein